MENQPELPIIPEPQPTEESFAARIANIESRIRETTARLNSIRNAGPERNELAQVWRGLYRELDAVRAEEKVAKKKERAAFAQALVEKHADVFGRYKVGAVKSEGEVNQDKTGGRHVEGQGQAGDGGTEQAVPDGT